MRLSVKGFRPTALREARKAKGWTQEQLSVALDAALGAIGGYEIGSISPQPRRLRELADALGVPIHSLVDVDHDHATVVDYRSWAGLSQSDAAQALGINVGRLSSIERGASPVPDELAVAIAGLFDVTTDQLMRASDRGQAQYRKNLQSG